MCFQCNQQTNLNFSITFATCKVCEIVDEDKRPKGVVFCDTCKVYICQSCWSNGTRRTYAAAINYGQKTMEKIKDVFKKYDNEKENTSEE